MSQTEPRVYHPLAPSPEAQRALWVYAGGALLGLGLLVLLAKRTHESGLRAALLGVGLAMTWGVIRAWWEWRQLMNFAHRASLSLRPDALHFTDPRGQEIPIDWSQLKGEMNGGRLQLSWPEGKLLVGAREWEDGMELTRLIASRLAPHRPTNFIPLELVSRPRVQPTQTIGSPSDEPEKTELTETEQQETEQ